MSIIIFLLVLSLLVFVHEFGHFSVAKFFGIRVDEFAIGFPPKVFSWKRGETTYALNLLPLGGYVKIFGENPEEESLTGPDSARSFANKNRGIQAGVLIAGIVCNIILAWVLFSTALGIGMTMVVSDYAGPGMISDRKILVTEVAPKSPASEAGMVAGDTLVSITQNKVVTLAEKGMSAIRDAVAQSKGKEITVWYEHGGDLKMGLTKAVQGIVPDRFALGISMEEVGKLTVPWYRAPIEGFIYTGLVVEHTAIGLADFFKTLFVGKADFNTVSGPVGIAKLVAEATHAGFTHLLTFTAMISINLALLNLVPFPALDGGRILFVGIEAIIRRRLPIQAVNWVNGAGFVLLLVFMAVITYQDVLKFFK
ncbi:MAG: hypothetical protein RLZZ347_168 [Candidatus Parcubacteria bacterium]|jgi:regulator of sigma E protease